MIVLLRVVVDGCRGGRGIFNAQIVVVIATVNEVVEVSCEPAASKLGLMVL